MVVVKIGGALIDEAGAPDALWTALRTVQARQPVVLVHGGGGYASQVARRLGHTPRIVQGRRVTTDLDLEIILWTLRGALNARLTAQARSVGIQAVGVSGVDDGLVQVERRSPWNIDGERVDFGWVGDVKGGHVDLLYLLLEAGRLPIVAPMGSDAAGQIYNVNADTVAVTLAQALGADQLYLVTEVGGVFRGPADPASRLATCSRQDFETGLTEGWITGGMRVKLNVAFQALDSGISDVFILAPDQLLNPEQGTLIVEKSP